MLNTLILVLFAVLSFFENTSNLFMAFILRDFLRLRSDFVSIMDPKNLHFLQSLQ